MKPLTANLHSSVELRKEMAILLYLMLYQIKWFVYLFAQHHHSHASSFSSLNFFFNPKKQNYPHNIIMKKTQTTLQKLKRRQNRLTSRMP